MSLASVWTIDGGSARLKCGPLTANVDLAAPARGLHALVLDGEAVAGSLLGVQATGVIEGAAAALLPADAYARQADLIVAYGAAPNLPFAMQVYWRAAAGMCGAQVVLDAIVSIQTRAWEAFPEVCVGSALDVESAAAADDALILRLPGGATSYAEMSVPGDFQRSAAAPASGRTSWSYGREFLERGVIRRLRLRGALVARRKEAEAVAAVRAALGAEAPPLTA